MIAWYICPYKRDLTKPRVTRYCAMNDFNNQIVADGGMWSEAEVLGDRAIVKVNASNSTLTTLDAMFKRLPSKLLNEKLADLPANVKLFLRNEILDMGYSINELQTRFGNDLSQFTFKDVLKFMSSRRNKPRYDAINDVIVLDGIEQLCRPIDFVDKDVN